MASGFKNTAKHHARPTEKSSVRTKRINNWGIASTLDLKNRERQYRNREMTEQTE